MMEEPTCPATPPLCKCPDTPPRAGSSKSSPSRWNDSTDIKEQSRSPSPGRPASPENCAICLGPLTDKSFTNSCCHQFCYVCLREWSKVKAECPLCKVAFASIIHNVRSQDDYDVDTVIREPQRPPPHPHLYTTYMPSATDIMALVGRYLPGAHGNYRPAFTFGVIPHGPPTYATRRANPNGTSAFRRSIYQRDLWARLQPDITGRYRDCSPEFYTQNPAQLHRLIPFLNRELNVLLESGGQTAYVMGKILELLPMHSIQSATFRSQVARLIGHQHAPHFCHELRAFASSTYDLVGYDRAVQYHPNGGAGYSIEIDDIESSDAGVSGPDDDDDVLIIENEPTATARRGASSSASASTSTASHSETSTHSHFPQRISSSIAHTSVVNVSSDSESDVAEDIQIVGYVKPRHERTPEVITLSSPEHPGHSTPPSTSAAHASGSYVNLTDSPICIRLGNNTAAAHKWHDGNLNDISSDDTSTSDNTYTYANRIKKSVKKSCFTKRRSSSQSSSTSCSEEEKERVRKKTRRSKHRKSKREDKSKGQKHSKSRKRKSTVQSSDEEEDSQPSTSKGRSKTRDKRDNVLFSPKRAQCSKPSTFRPRSSDFSESDHSSPKSVIRSAIVQNGFSNRYSSGEDDTSSHASGSKGCNLVMTRTRTDQGHASWIVAGGNSSSDSHRNNSDRREHHQSSHHSHNRRKKSSHSDRKRRERSRSSDSKNIRKKIKPIAYSDDSETN
ncbi:E3 ubiquitin-protein ligase Topors [Thrips palmi]|uniref:E3 ubiquitin-protein ligase Topors n=1 Tax=Thrips palmi TaxID=161013 RepID=A0A6P8YHF5_THRPL|nr:E3 ubiquitin-protein ligase Topors [Thrips palmi]